MRLLFTTAPLRGHFFPLVPLAWAARSAGHEVLVATTENFVPVVLRAGLPAVSWGPPGEAFDLAAEGLAGPAGAPGRLRERRFAHGRVFGRIAARCLPGARSVVRAWKPDLLVCERAEFAGPLAATALDVPYAEYHWGVAALAEYRTAAAGELTAVPAPPALSLDPWPRRMRLPHARDHQGLRNVPYNGDEWLEEWMLARPRRRRVCLTFGTVLPRIEELEIRHIVAGILTRLARLDVEVLVAADEHTLARWPDSATAAAHRVGRLPLSQVLPACDLVVNHGGQGTVLTALAAGCPQLVLPYIDDQFDNAGAVAATGAGECLSFGEITPAAVAESCRTLLEDGRYADAAATLADELAALPSPAESLDLLEKAAG